jgi:hypothetical protein
MRVLLGDPPIDWPKITQASQARAWGSRDAYAASVVRTQVLDKSRRALLCYGMAHLFHSVPEAHLPPDLVTILRQRTGERTYVIADLVPFAGDPGGLARKLSVYPRDTVIPAAGTWLGSFDAGLFAQLTFRSGSNPYCGVPLRSIIDAGLYLGQPVDLTQSYWNPAIFLDPAYWAELRRRNTLMGHPVDLESYRVEQPAHLPLLELAPSAECVQAEQSS